VALGVIAGAAVPSPARAAGTISIMAPEYMPKRHARPPAKARPRRHPAPSRRPPRRRGSGGLVVIPRAPVGPAPGAPGVPAYTPPPVQAPAQRPFCQSRGQAFDPATHSFVTGGDICR
jgi:hypothetical protein